MVVSFFGMMTQILSFPPVEMCFLRKILATGLCGIPGAPSVLIVGHLTNAGGHADWGGARDCQV